MKQRKRLVAVILMLGLLAYPVCAHAKGKEGGGLRAAVQNPISSLISLPFKFSFDYGAPNARLLFSISSR